MLRLLRVFKLSKALLDDLCSSPSYVTAQGFCCAWFPQELSEARDWPAEGGQRLTRADPCRQNAMIQKEQAEKWRRWRRAREVWKGRQRLEKNL